MLSKSFDRHNRDVARMVETLREVSVGSSVTLPFDSLGPGSARAKLQSAANRLDMSFLITFTNETVVVKRVY